MYVGLTTPSRCNVINISENAREKIIQFCGGAKTV